MAGEGPQDAGNCRGDTAPRAVKLPKALLRLSGRPSQMTRG